MARPKLKETKWDIKSREKAKKWYYDNLKRAKLARKEWYIKNKEKVIAYQKEWRKKNKEEQIQKSRERYKNLPIEIKLERQKRNRERYYKNRTSELEIKRIKFEKEYPKARLAVLSYYGFNKNPICVCCKEDNIIFLTIDHIKRLKKGERQGNIVYWILKNNFPKGFQTLCFNCNLGRAKNNDICPHKLNEIKTKLDPIHLKWNGQA